MSGLKGEADVPAGSSDSRFPPFSDVPVPFRDRLLAADFLAYQASFQRTGQGGNGSSATLLPTGGGR